MTGHIAALINMWKTSEREATEAAAFLAHEGHQEQADICLSAVRSLKKLRQQLEAARDADCAEWRKRLFNDGKVPPINVHDCIRDLGGKP